MLVGPRNMIEGSEPGWPLPEMIVAPAIFPWIAVPAETGMTFMMSAAFTCSTVNASWVRGVAAATPVTTTPSSETARLSRVKFTCAAWPACTVTVWVAGARPISSARTSREPTGTFTMRNRPCAFESAPSWRPGR
jgi:hypothetical protein